MVRNKELFSWIYPKLNLFLDSYTISLFSFCSVSFTIFLRFVATIFSNILNFFKTNVRSHFREIFTGIISYPIFHLRTLPQMYSFHNLPLQEQPLPKWVFLNIFLFTASFRTFFHFLQFYLDCIYAYYFPISVIIFLKLSYSSFTPIIF